MPDKTTPYVLSAETEKDLAEIHDYTARTFGKPQAAVYLAGMEEKFHALAAQPELGRARNEIREGLRSLTYERHMILYRTLPGKIRIVRVLHGGRDIPKQFQNE